MMMMAYNSGPERGALSEETIDAMRTALAAYIDAPVAGDALREALRAVAAEAREKAIRPEQLLVVLKDIWYGLPSVRRIGDASEQIRLLQRVVTMCIHEYYAD
jgi:hypothetical protein